MVQLWRLTRNRYGRAVYDALRRVGITATTMTEYARELDTLPEERSPAADLTAELVIVLVCGTNTVVNGEDVLDSLR